MNLTEPQRRDLRDRFALAIAGGYETWRWSRRLGPDGTPDSATNESVARAIWAHADMLLLTRDAETGIIPCPSCGWHSFSLGHLKVVCLRCKKVWPVPVNKRHK